MPQIRLSTRMLPFHEFQQRQGIMLPAGWAKLRRGCFFCAVLSYQGGREAQAPLSL